MINYNYQSGTERKPLVTYYVLELLLKMLFAPDSLNVFLKGVEIDQCINDN